MVLLSSLCLTWDILVISRAVSSQKETNIHSSCQESLVGNAELNNLRLCTYCITRSNTALLLLCYSISFPVASTTPLLSDVTWWNGNALRRGECLGPLHHMRMQVKFRMIGQNKNKNKRRRGVGGKLDLRWMESAVIKSTRAVNAYVSYIPV